MEPVWEGRFDRGSVDDREVGGEVEVEAEGAEGVDVVGDGGIGRMSGSDSVCTVEDAVFGRASTGSAESRFVDFHLTLPMHIAIPTGLLPPRASSAMLAGCIGRTRELA